MEVETASRGAEVKGWLHSGNYAMNYAMTGRLLRGYPIGHVTEVFGDNSTGKSYLLARALSETQQAGGFALLDDSEGALNLDWAARLGVDTDTLAYKRSRTVHEHMLLLDAILGILEKASAADKEKPVCVALDSLAALTTEHELNTLEKNTKDMQRAQEIHKLFRVAGGLLKKTNAVYMLANHKIAPMNQFSKADSTGGGGPKFYSSVRLDLRTPSYVKDSRKEVVGAIVRVVVFKTRWTGSFKESRLYIPYYSALSPYSGLVDLLINQKILAVRGKSMIWAEAEEDTGVAAPGKDFIKQDRLAEQLIDAYPDLLQEVDKMFEERAVDENLTVEDANEDGEPETPEE